MHPWTPVTDPPPAESMVGALYESWPRPDGTVHLRFVSPGAEDVLESTAEELAERLVRRTVPLFGVDADEFYRSVEESARGHTGWRAEFGYVGPRTGTRRWLRAVDFPRRSADGQPYFTGVVLDVTRVRADRDHALLAYRVLAGHLENTPLAVIEWDYDHRFVRWSGQAEALFGWPAAEALGRKIDDLRLVHPADSGRVDAVIRRLLSGAEPRNVCVNRNLDRAGRELVCEWHNSVVHDDAGRLVSVLSLAQDLTERVTAEQELARTEERLKMALASTRTLVWDLDGATGHVFLSQPYGDFYGAPELGVNPGPDARMLCAHPTDRERASRAAAEAITAGAGPFRFDFRGVADAADGTPRWFEVNGTVLRDAAGRAARTIGVTTDVSDRKRADQARELLARQVNEARRYDSLGVLAGGLVHDFNNLLTVIVGNAGLCAADLPAGSPLQDNLAAIEAACQRAAQVCSQMTACAGVGRLCLTPLDVGELLRQAEPSLRTESGSAELVVDWPPHPLTILGEAFQIRQAVRTLVTNAAEASGPAGGRIELQVARTHVPTTTGVGFRLAPPAAGDFVSVRVTDNGTGMTAATADRAFDPFFSTKFSGRGLGLAAVHGIAKGHRGGIRLTTAPGAGTTVELLLPLSEVLAERPVRPPVAAPPPHVLVVDDEIHIRELIASVLEDDGASVSLAADGPEAVAAVAADPERYGLAVVDLVMPGISGYDLIGELRRMRPGLPVVLVSGFADRELPDEVRGGGPTVALTKPFRLEQLTRAMSAARDGRSDLG